MSLLQLLVVEDVDLRRPGEGFFALSSEDHLHVLEHGLFVAAKATDTGREGRGCGFRPRNLLVVDTDPLLDRSNQSVEVLDVVFHLAVELVAFLHEDFDIVLQPRDLLAAQLDGSLWGNRTVPENLRIAQLV